MWSILLSPKSKVLNNLCEDVNELCKHALGSSIFSVNCVQFLPNHPCDRQAWVHRSSGDGYSDISSLGRGSSSWAGIPPLPEHSQGLSAHWLISQPTWFVKRSTYKDATFILSKNLSFGGFCWLIQVYSLEQYKSNTFSTKPRFLYFKR